MASTGQVLAQTDMDKDVDMGGEFDNGADTEAPLDDLDNIAADLDAGGEDMGDDFGAEDSEEPLGRAMKMESAMLQRKVMEMRKLVAKARALREAQDIEDTTGTEEVDEKVEVLARNKYSGDNTFSRTKKDPANPAAVADRNKAAGYAKEIRKSGNDKSASGGEIHVSKTY